MSMCQGITLTFLHASTSGFVHNFLPTPGRFSSAFRPKLSVLISAITTRIVQATLPHFQLFTLIGLSCSGHVALYHAWFSLQQQRVSTAPWLARWAICAPQVKRSNLAYSAFFSSSFFFDPGEAEYLSPVQNIFSVRITHFHRNLHLVHSLMITHKHKKDITRALVRHGTKTNLY